MASVQEPSTEPQPVDAANAEAQRLKEEAALRTAQERACASCRRASGTGYKCVVYNSAFGARPFNVQCAVRRGAVRLAPRPPPRRRSATRGTLAPTRQRKPPPTRRRSARRRTSGRPQGRHRRRDGTSRRRRGLHSLHSRRRLAAAAAAAAASTAAAGRAEPPRRQRAPLARACAKLHTRLPTGFQAGFEAGARRAQEGRGLMGQSLATAGAAGDIVDPRKLAKVGGSTQASGMSTQDGDPLDAHLDDFSNAAEAALRFARRRAADQQAAEEGAAHSLLNVSLRRPPTRCGC